MTSDLCLNQVISLCADVFKEACDVDSAFFFHLLQHAVQDDVGACPTDTSTATTAIKAKLKCVLNLRKRG